jgi:sugar/nucleoside kinase (ribokinase family)
MGVAETLKTELGVFAGFDPVLPVQYRDTPFLFLANIDPEIQLRVLQQARRPRFTLLDTMNLWIGIKKAALLKVMRRVDAVIVNDQEIRQLTGKSSLIQAAQALLKSGPRLVVLKRGEHGASLYGKNELFHVPAFPVETVKDPTGAGDSFAGGFIGHLASAQGGLTKASLRRAMAYGTVMASFNVEDFSVARVSRLKAPEIHARFRKLHGSTRFC